MFVRLLSLIFGSKNERELKVLEPLIAQINDMESSLQSLSNEALADKTQTFKKRFESAREYLSGCVICFADLPFYVPSQPYINRRLLLGLVVSGKLSEVLDKRHCSP